MNSPISFPGLGLTFKIDPVAFTLFGADFYWYGVIIAVGLALAILYAFSQMKRFGIDSNRAVDVIFVGTIAAIVGARLYYVAFQWDMFKDDLSSILFTRDGGMAIYGGIIGALIFGLLMCKIRKVKMLPMLDITGLGLLIGQAIGRWGNFVNQEAFGGNTTLPWGMTSKTIQNYLTIHQASLQSQGMTIDPTMPVHPCFLYESLWCALGFLLLHLYRKHRKFDGEMFLMYIGWYGFGRFVIEGLRTDSLMLGSIRISQLVALLCVIGAVVTILIIRSKKKRSNDPDFMPLYVSTAESKELLEKEQERELRHKVKLMQVDAVLDEAVKEAEAEEAQLEKEEKEKLETPEETKDEIVKEAPPTVEVETKDGQEDKKGE